MFIIFEGADKTGKSTLIKRLNEATDYKHWVLDRGIISSIVYNDIYKRKNEKMYFKYLEKIKEINPLIIFTYSSIENIEGRLNNSKEELPNVQKEYGLEGIQFKFLDYIQKSGLRYVIVSTNKTIEENLDYILKVIEEEELNEE